MDTNVVIDYLAGKIPKAGMKFLSSLVDKRPNISVISKIELLRFNMSPESAAILNDFVAHSIIYPMDNKVVDITIKICREHKIKLPDAVIAATCIAHDLILLTRNTDDFKNIVRLKWQNPWNIIP